MKTYYATEVMSPHGPIIGVVDDKGAVVCTEFPNGRSLDDLTEDYEAQGITLRTDPRRTTELRRQLRDYFAGKRETFELRVSPNGTDFQQAVWREMRRIGYGKTRSYGELAERIGHAGAARAVGAASGANPVPILIPCHRVVGSNGSLTGFGGGLELKARLLELEAGQRRLL